MNDDVRAAKAQQWCSYTAGRKYTLTTLSGTLVLLALGMVLNIVSQAIEALR